MAFTGEIGHLTDIESPWGNAGGVVKTIEDVERMAHTGVGWIEAGSYTLEPRKGNAWNPETEQYDRSVYYHNPATGETFNSLGMPNNGMDVVETEIPEMARIAHAHNKALVINVAPVSNDPGPEAFELIARAYEKGADGVILNAGCPNVRNEDGTTHSILSRSPDEFGGVLLELADFGGFKKPIWVRLSPQESYYGMKEITDSIVAYNGLVSTILLPNTFLSPKPQDAEGNDLITANVQQVGKSGPAMAAQSRDQTAYAFGNLRKSIIDVIASSSITNAAELKRHLALGAVAGAGTTFFYESPNWNESVDRMLFDLAA